MKANLMKQLKNVNVPLDTVNDRNVYSLLVIAMMVVITISILNITIQMSVTTITIMILIVTTNI